MLKEGTLDNDYVEKAVMETHGKILNKICIGGDQVHRL